MDVRRWALAFALSALLSAALIAQAPRVLDLGHPLRGTDPSWDGKQAFKREGTPQNGRFESQEHFGTHLDAPAHFGGTWTTDRIPTDRLVRPGVCVNITGKSEDYQITVADVKAWESRHGAVPEGSVVLFATGWDARWPDRKAYMNERGGVKHFPGLSVELG
jgi:kynurenine formamidase